MENTAQDMTTAETEASEAKVLVVTSKVKKYIKATAGMNTSGDFAEALTVIVEAEIKKAIAKAQEAGRKTVMGRDVVVTN